MISLKKIAEALLILFLTSTFTAIAQSPVSSFIAMDDSVKQMISFYDCDTILVVLPDNYKLRTADKVALENFVFWKARPVYAYIHESELKDSDMHHSIQYFGPAHKFSKQVLEETPFKKETNGFSFHQRLFQNPEDAFYYMHPVGRKIYTCRNGEEFPLVYISFMAGPYQLYVFSGRQIIYSGYETAGLTGNQINDMDLLRSQYFCNKQKSQFFNLYFACSFSPDSISGTAAREMDQFVTELCKYLNVEPTGIHSITSYFYPVREDLQYFIAAPLWQTIYGKSFGDINHITGFDLATVKHETGHSIIAAKIGDNPNPFFAEGFRQASDYYFSKEAYIRDLETYKNNTSLLTAELVISDNALFFRNWSNYAIAGVFTNYLIERTGLEAFKDAYARNEIEQLLKSRGTSIEKLIGEFISANR